MLASGSSLDTVDNISTHDLMMVYNSYRIGLAGPYKDYIISYNLHAPTDKRGKLIKFQDLFKEVYDCMELKLDSRQQTPQEQAKAAAQALGMPAHIYERLSGGG